MCESILCQFLITFAIHSLVRSLSHPWLVPLSVLQSHEIHDLETYTQYLVSIQVFNPEGLGPPTTVLVMTDEGGKIMTKHFSIFRNDDETLARSSERMRMFIACCCCCLYRLQNCGCLFWAVLSLSLGLLQNRTSHTFIMQSQLPFRIYCRFSLMQRNDTTRFHISHSGLVVSLSVRRFSHHHHNMEMT